jgi:hypothetical protein
MRQSGILMMHPVIRFVQQRVSKETTEPTFRYDTASRAVHGIPGQPEMFDVFAPALEIRRDHRRCQVEPKEIFPTTPKRERPQNSRPRNEGEGKLQPNSPPHFPTSNRRIGMEENTQEDERRIEQTDGQFEERSETTRPKWHPGQDEWPEFYVPFSGKMHVMHLVHRPVETKRKKTENAHKHAIEFIQSPALSQQTVGSLVKADEQSVH